MNRIVQPGATLGVLGSGQLGRMFAIAARRMGYRVHTFSPGIDTPTGQVADVEFDADYDDLDAIRAFARGVDVITFEFENVLNRRRRCRRRDRAGAAERPRPARDAAARPREGVPRRSGLSGHAVRVGGVARGTDHRARPIGTPAILKTASFGYDGKGQHRLTSPLDAEPVWALVGHQAAVLEKLVDFTLEISVVAARGLDGAFAHYGAIENSHRDHILDVSVAPARMPAAAVTEAVAVTRAIMDELAYVGVLCVEFFLTTDGRILVNEVAPRPHNSGHLTIDASITSQFEQQVRAICGLPLGATTLLRPAAMANLLGDVWAKGEPKWDAALAVPDVKLHLYGKTAPRAGRKMGHLTAMADTPAQAIQHVLAARDVLV